MAYFLSFYGAVFALLASFTLFYQAPNDRYLRLFPYFLIINAPFLGISDYLAYRAKFNVWLINPLTIFQCCFYFYSLHRIIHHRVIRMIAFHLVWVYPLMAIANLLFVQNQENAFHSITYSLGGLLIVAFCVFYFIELFQRPLSGGLARNPDFWICSGLLFYFSCSFPIYGMANHLTKIPRFIYNNINTIFNSLDILLYSSFAIAFLCRLRIRKSSL